MHNLVLVVLYALFIYAAMDGFLAISSASSAFHQIYGAVWVAVAAICASGIGITHAISHVYIKSKSEEEQKNETEK